jgi:3'-phosphoadenosine 5'-phosphosulfate sulfotransferase (PAPS reductase)/FAD synthetase
MDRLPDPCVVSFSGGRTSGFMLWNILQAFGGTLPPYVHVVFCNTGRERPETLDFVERCSQRFGVKIAWLEYRLDAPTEVPTRRQDWVDLPHGERLKLWREWDQEMVAYAEKMKHTFAVVDYSAASRDGQPFEEVIAARKFLPNPIMRFCTAELKIRTTNRYVRQLLGLETYHNAIGLRADENSRVARMIAKRKTTYTPTLWEEWVIKETIRGADLPPGETPIFPLHAAGATEADVMSFWAAQPFDLKLSQDEGNCDLCFLKGGKKLIGILERRPDLAAWWIAQEERIKHRARPETERFRADRPQYSELLAIAKGEAQGPGWLFGDVGNACGFIGTDTECRCTD